MKTDSETALKMANDVVELFHRWEHLGYGIINSSDNFIINQVVEHIKITGGIVERELFFEKNA